ncbi:MAG TPA: amidohydrolase family protein [Polyangiaceae bacterium]
MASSRKADPEPPLRSPIDFDPPSNGEFCPRPTTARARRAERLFREIVEDKHRRVGMTRREFASSACGMAAALHVLNLVGCGSSERAEGKGPSGGDAGYDVDAGMLEDGGRARERLTGDEFVFDVQVHVSEPLAPWTEKRPPEQALDFITQIFVESDTTVACVTGVPAVRDLGVGHVQAHAQVQEIIDRLGGPRLIFHGSADPDRGASELDFMAEIADRYAISAFKTYPHAGTFRLDSDEVGSPYIEQARALGVRVLATHRGLSGGGGYDVSGSPVDVVRAAKNHPDMKFLVYHSGWEADGDENHPFDPSNTDPTGVDRFVKALIDNGIGPDGNVWAELGTTWFNLLLVPDQAAHVLGKLLKQLGPDRVLYGTDCVLNGAPQSQIVALRAFVIPEAMQEAYGYPALTDDVRKKLLGLNGAAVYGVDPEVVRYRIAGDDIEMLRTAYRNDPRSVPVPRYGEYTGPRTRHEFFEFLRRERHARG